MSRSLRVRAAGWLVGVLATAGLAIMLWIVSTRHQVPTVGDSNSDQADIAPRKRPTPPAAGFVGSHVCGECHPVIAESFRKHPMAHSARPVSVKLDVMPPTGMSPETVAQTSFTAAPGLEYHISQQGKQVLHEEILKDSSGTILTRQSVPVDFAIGSGKRGRSYIIDRQGLLFVSPIAWYSQKKRWDLSPGYQPFRHERFERFAPAKCLRCHVGRPNPVSRETPDRFQRPIFLETSIGCENCHGPGQGHVRFQQQDTPDGKDPIVNLSQLSPPLRDSVCNQCHLSGRDVALRYGRTPYDFRPGMHLTDVFCLLTQDPKRSRNKKPGKAVSHVEQMHSSQCYQKSAGSLGCISCHNPHSVPSAAERETHYRNRCLTCHQDPQRTCSLPAPERMKSPQGNSCISCHMPGFNATDIPHTTQTDHRILRNPSANDDNALETNRSPPAFEDLMIFGADVGKLPPVAQTRARNIMLARLLESQPSQQHAKSAKDALSAILKAAPDDIEVLDALARCSKVLKQPDEAIAYWNRILKLSPRHMRTLYNLANYSFQIQRYRQAVQYFDRFLKENPWLAEVYANRSIALVRLGRLQEAVRDIRSAIKRNPTEPRYYTGLSELSLWTGQKKTAQSAGEIARKLREIRSHRPFQPKRPRR